MNHFEARVWDDNAHRLVRLEHDQEAGGLSVMVDEGDRAASLLLTDRGVRQLRLALARYERQRAGAA
jgi:hypothetical protein